MAKKKLSLIIFLGLIISASLAFLCGRYLNSLQVFNFLSPAENIRQISQDHLIREVITNKNETEDQTEPRIDDKQQTKP